MAYYIDPNEQLRQQRAARQKKGGKSPLSMYQQYQKYSGKGSEQGNSWLDRLFSSDSSGDGWLDSLFGNSGSTTGSAELPADWASYMGAESGAGAGSVASAELPANWASFMGAESGAGFGGGGSAAGAGASSAGAGSAGGGAGGSAGGAGWAGIAAIIAAVIAAQHAATNANPREVDGHETGDVFSGDFGTEPWFAWLSEQWGLDPTAGEEFDAAVADADQGKALGKLPATLDYWANPIDNWLASLGRDQWGDMAGLLIDPIGTIFGWLGG